MPSLDTRQPFTRAQAIAAGITPTMLRGPRFRQLFRGVYLDTRVGVPREEVRIRAALMVHPAGSFASHHSAAELYGLPVPHSPAVHVSVFHKSDRRTRTGIATHLACPQQLTSVRGIPCSSPLQLFIDLAGVLGLVDLVVLGDAIVRRELATCGELVAACTAWRGRYARVARRAASYVRAKVDSPMESRLRMLIVLSGLPEPEVNFELRNDSEILVCQPDLSYPHLKIAIEYDGQEHRADLARWEKDIDRTDWLERNGWKVVPVVSKGIYRRPDKTLQRVHAALEERRCADLPRVPSDEWRQYFPVRR
jgi:very-short-patch-repair endonuclease